MEAKLALVYDSGIRALDANGNPYVGAELTVYNAGTTTLASVYRDSGLSSALTNPLSGADASDSSGRFPQIFAAEGAVFDLELKTSGGVVIWSQSDVPSLGEGSGEIFRDFGTSRYHVGNSSGTVRVEGGRPVGNDTGGYITLGGYSGSQADLVTLDGSSVNTTGTFTEKGKALPGVIYTGKTTFSAVSSVAIALPNSPTGVCAWDVDIVLTSLSTTMTLTLTFSTNSGTSYLSTQYFSQVLNATGTTVSTAASIGGGPGAASGSLHTTSIGGTPPGYINLRVIQSNPTGAIAYVGRLLGDNGSGSPVLAQSGGQVLSPTAKVTNVKLTASTGNFTGSYSVIPLRAFN